MSAANEDHVEGSGGDDDTGITERRGTAARHGRRAHRLVGAAAGSGGGL